MSLTENNTNCSLFVVFHSRLHEEQYLGNEVAYTFAKVGDKPAEIVSPKIREGVVECCNMSGFVDKGKHWAESEFLISLYHTLKKNPNYLNGSRWVGFLQYDHTCTSRKGENLLAHLQENLEQIGDEKIVCFAPIDLATEVNSTRIAMDFSNPQKLQGDPLCYFPMIADYNKFYGTKHKYTDFIGNKTIALCSAFVISTANFMKMMEFVIWAADKNNLDQFDPERKHRLAGGLMERYYGTWIALTGLGIHEFQVSELPKF
jgi:hypothetical protein